MSVSEGRLPHIIVRQSRRGRGVFARHALCAGECVIEYKGEWAAWEAALSRLVAGELPPGNAVFLGMSDGYVMVGARERNPARWINHSCEPNCRVQVRNGRAFVRAVGPIAAAKEITIDYALAVEPPRGPAMTGRFACRCGAKTCRGTMLAIRRAEPERRAAASANHDAAPVACEAQPCAPAQVRVLERLAGNRLAICWRQPGRALYGEQVWLAGLATAPGRCALSQRAFDAGTPVFAPSGTPQPVNGDARILVEAVDSLDLEMLA